MMKSEILYGVKFRHVHALSMKEWDDMEAEALQRFKRNRKRYQHFNAGRKSNEQRHQRNNTTTTGISGDTQAGIQDGV